LILKDFFPQRIIYVKNLGHYLSDINKIEEAQKLFSSSEFSKNFLFLFIDTQTLLAEFACLPIFKNRF